MARPSKQRKCIHNQLDIKCVKRNHPETSGAEVNDHKATEFNTAINEFNYKRFTQIIFQSMPARRKFKIVARSNRYEHNLRKTYLPSHLA